MANMFGTNGTLAMFVPQHKQTGTDMSENTDKAAGLANEALGKAKQGVGSVVGSGEMKSEGAAQELKGDAQKLSGDAKNTTKEAVDKTAGALKKPL